MSIGIERAILLETDGQDWDPIATSDAIVAAMRADGTPFDLIFFGNEAADTGDYQVGIRVAYALGLPCVTGIKQLSVNGSMLTAKRGIPGGWETYEVPCLLSSPSKKG